MIACKVILFDLDGTLTDSKQGIVNSIRYAINKLQLAAEDIDLELFIGPPLAESFEKYFGLDNQMARQAVSVYREYYAVKGIFENKLYPGIFELLRELNNNNKTLVCVTSKAKYYAEQVLRHFNIDQYFSYLVGSNMDLTCTHKKDLIKWALSYFPNFDKTDFIMVGDRADDIIGAKENKVKAIGVLYGYGSVNEIKAQQPAFIVRSVNELKKLLIG